MKPVKKLLILFIFLAGCEKAPVPDQNCDYCRKPRLDAMVYSCRKCGKTHRSCMKESPLHALEYSKASKTGESGGAIGRAIKNCPE